MVERSPASCTGLVSADPTVRTRMAEYLGGPPLEAASAVFVLGRRDSREQDTGPRPPTELGALLDGGFEVCRSLWDRRALLAHLDIEYVNFDFPGEPYLEPERSFGLQRPVVRAVRHLLDLHGIPALHLLSGRGHHFVWTVGRDTPAFRRLAELGRPPESLLLRYARPHPPRGEVVEPELGLAFAGLGLVMEHLGHAVRDLAEPESAIPVELAEIPAGRPVRGREVVVIDLSEYGDALHQRHVTIPFSAYLKPYQQRKLLGEAVARGTPMRWVIPRPEGSEPDALRMMRDHERVLMLARGARAVIPSAEEGTERLVDAYLESPLRRFHEHFYSSEHDRPDTWHRTYDRTAPERLPPCARRVLERPNDLLLQPAGILKVVRALGEDDWHPRHVAGLVRSRYERDHGWGRRWYRDDASARADYYVRLLAGMIALGRAPRDELHCPAGLAPELCRAAGCPGA
jgi:hypothetical protein